MKTWLKKFYDSYYWVIILVIILDQVTKYFAMKANVEMWVIDGFFKLSYSRNKAIAWSLGYEFFVDNPWVLPMISLVAGMAMIGFRIYKNKSLNWLYRLVIALLIGGTFGNYIDRQFFPEGVIDFLEFHFWSYEFPTFNVADMSLVIAVIAIMAISLFEKEAIPAKGENHGE
jgi:signal peptidase II